jgi:hypothetical protein
MSKKVGGVEISGDGCQELAQDLDLYCQVSSIASQLVQDAGRVGATVEMQRSGKICHASKTTVKVSQDACLDKTTGLPSPTYLAESVLFELQNAVNALRYSKVRSDALNGRVSILQYGHEYCRLEFESTAKVVSILTQMKAAGRPISPWGAKQFSGYALGPTHFGNQPHDPAALDEQRLPSKLFYAYAYLQDEVKLVKNMKQKVLKRLATIKKGSKSLSSFNMGVLVGSWGTKYSAMTPMQFFVAYIDALSWLGNERSWSVGWEGGTQSEWKVCATEFARHVALVNRRQVAEGIKKDLEAATYG